MRSPFPGVDPFIEDQLWDDFHARYITVLAEILAPSLEPDYFALVERRVYLEHLVDNSGAGSPSRTIRPDVSVVEDRYALAQPQTGDAPITTVPVPVTLVLPESVEETYLTIRTLPDLEVVTVIELLSPTNKRPGSDGEREYREKRDAVLRSGTHLVEIDLLRGGRRIPTTQPLPAAEYYVIVSRSSRRPIADVWPIGLRDPLPSIVVPLSGAGSGVDLDLGVAFHLVYERGRYARLLDHHRDLSPSVSIEDAAWVTQTLAGQ